MKEEFADVVRKVGYQFMAFNDAVYFIGNDKIEVFCLIKTLN